MIMEASGDSDSNFTLCSNASSQPRCMESNNLGDDLLEDLDSYLEDINDRLTISRMVSDSVIKGMVNAVTEEAAERIAVKELEVELLKERLRVYESGTCETRTLDTPEPSAVVQHDRAESCLPHLRKALRNQFHILQKKIKDVESYKLISGQRKMEESEKWAELDETLNNFGNSLNTVWAEVDSMICSSETSFCEWQERKLRDEVEAMVFQNSIRNLQQEFEVHLQEQRAQFCSSQTTNQLAKLNELSSLRQEVRSISKILSSPETGQANGSHGGSENLDNDKRNDHLHRSESNHISRANSSMELNYNDEEAKVAVEETVDYPHLKDKSKDEVINYFKTLTTKMRRNHESLMQEKTEEYFSLKRNFFKDKGPLYVVKRDKEFEAFRKKVPEVLVKLDHMLVENEKVLLVHENKEMICTLENKIATLLSENQHLQDLLTHKSKEVTRLLLQVSNAEDKMLHHSMAEANLLKQIRNLKSDVEDMGMEVSIREDVCKYILRDLIGRATCVIQDSQMENKATLEMYETIIRESTMDAKSTITCDIEDTNIESIIMQEVCGIIFREAAKDAMATISFMKMKHEEDNDERVSLQASILESKKALSMEMEENDKLKQTMLKLSSSLDDKEKLVLEKDSLLMKEKERYELINQETSTTNIKLEESVRQTVIYKEKISKLDQKLIVATEDLKTRNEEMQRLYGILQEKETALSLVESRELDQKKQSQSIIASVQRFLNSAADFEGRIVEIVEKNNTRLKCFKTQLDPLFRESKLSRRAESVYKQRLENRYSDLQKAEAEVDLLGDEVDALLTLLEKIYIALCHYSPVLQHYPGIMEILELIKRELSVETSYDQKRISGTAKSICSPHL